VRLDVVLGAEAAVNMVIDLAVVLHERVHARGPDEAVACTGSAHPNTNSVCVSAGDSSSKCATINGWNTAQVFIDPIGSGHYVSTGNGCVDRSSSLKLTCTPYGPLNGGA
jgi:hypothetical protein